MIGGAVREHIRRERDRLLRAEKAAMHGPGWHKRSEQIEAALNRRIGLGARSPADQGG